MFSIRVHSRINMLTEHTFARAGLRAERINPGAEHFTSSHAGKRLGAKRQRQIVAPQTVILNERRFHRE